MVKLATKNSESLPENIEGHSAAGWGIVGFVYIILQTAGPSMQSLKPVRSGNGQPLIALRCLLLMPISTPLRIVNRCCSVLVSCKRRYTFNLYRINKYKNFKKKLLRNVPVSRIHCSATRLCPSSQMGREWNLAELFLKLICMHWGSQIFESTSHFQDGSHEVISRKKCCHLVSTHTATA